MASNGIVQGGLGLQQRVHELYIIKALQGGKQAAFLYGSLPEGPLLQPGRVPPPLEPRGEIRGLQEAPVEGYQSRLGAPPTPKSYKLHVVLLVYC